MRGRERDGILWDCKWLLVRAGCVRVVREADRNDSVWDWYWLMLAGRGEIATRVGERKVLYGTVTG